MQYRARCANVNGSSVLVSEMIMRERLAERVCVWKELVMCSTR